MYRFGELLSHHTKEIANQNAIFFCGAGISIKSGIPSALAIINDISKSINVTQSDIDYIYNSPFPFEAFVETIADGSEIEEILKVFLHGKPNSNHIFLAKLSKIGHVKTICTTNFDVLIETALENEGLKLGEDYTVYYKEDDFSNIDWSDNIIKLIKIHGCIKHPETVATTLKKVAGQLLVEQRTVTIEELFSYDAKPRTVVVMGYSCSDIFDICPAIDALDSNLNNVYVINHKQQIYAYSDFVDIENAEYPFEHFNTKDSVSIDTDYYVENLWKKLIDSEYTNTPYVKNEHWDTCLGRWLKQLDGESVKYSIAGNIFIKLSNFHVAKTYIEKSLVVAKEEAINDSICVDLNNLATCCHGLREYGKEIALSKKAIKISKKMNNNTALAKALGNMGLAYRNTQKYKKAKKYLLKSLDIWKIIEHAEQEARTLSNLGMVYINLKMFEEAKECLYESLVTARRLGDKLGESNRLGNLGLLNSRTGNYKEAIMILNDAVDVSKKIGDKRREASFLNNIGYAHYTLGEKSSALSYFENAKSIFSSLYDGDHPYVKQVDENIDKANKL